jgi:hypothetical protein
MECYKALNLLNNVLNSGSELMGGPFWQTMQIMWAMGGAEKVAIPWGNHSLSNRVQETIHCIIDFIKREGPKGWDDPWGWWPFRYFQFIAH